MVDFNNHPWVHQGNINKVKKIIMEVEEFYREKIQELENKIKELKAELKLENEIKRSIVTDLEMDIDELVEVIKGLDPNNPILQHLKS
tara:strand:- start:1570 stop:1833 length:264 start_codon:yes stop_codon:yes gene_type:complete